MNKMKFAIDGKLVVVDTDSEVGRQFLRRSSRTERLHEDSPGTSADLGRQIAEMQARLDRMIAEVAQKMPGAANPDRFGLQTDARSTAVDAASTRYSSEEMAARQALQQGGRLFKLPGPATGAPTYQLRHNNSFRAVSAEVGSKLVEDSTLALVEISQNADRRYGVYQCASAAKPATVVEMTQTLPTDPATAPHHRYSEEQAREAKRKIFG